MANRSEPAGGRPNRWLLIGLAALVVAIYLLTIVVQAG